MTGTITALVGCQNHDCATEVSYPLGMVRKLKDQPICETCYVDGGYATLDEDGVPEVA